MSISFNFFLVICDKYISGQASCKCFTFYLMMKLQTKKCFDWYHYCNINPINLIFICFQIKAPESRGSHIQILSCIAVCRLLHWSQF